MLSKSLSQPSGPSARFNLLCESEARPFRHPRSPKALQAIDRRWGSAVGAEAAEAFAGVRIVKNHYQEKVYSCLCSKKK